MNAPKRTRVLLVINDLARAGAETQLVELAVRLDREAFEPRIVLLKSRNDFADQLDRAGVPVTRLGRRGWWDGGVVRRLQAEIERFQPQIVHGWLFLANLASALAVRRGSGRRLVLSQRCSYEATAIPVWRRVARWSHRRADRVTVNSRAVLEEEVAAGHPRASLVYVPNGVGRGAVTAPRESLGLPAGPLVVSVGQLARIKGHHVLLRAWSQVMAQTPGAHLVLVGSGPCAEVLAGQARALGIESSVTFAGFRSPAAPYIAAADVFVHPSLTEGMPNAVLEAMALGRPVVASTVGGVPELIDDESEGLLVPASDSDGLATAVARLLVDRALAVRLGAAAQRRAANRFTFERVVAETEGLYRSLVPTVPGAGNSAVGSGGTRTAGRSGPAQ